MSVLDDFVRKKTINSLFCEIIDCENLCYEIAKQSYLHVNGFLKVTLGSNTDGQKLRLHIWDVSENFEVFHDIGMHNHPWDFYSTVLCGTVVNEIYNESNYGDQYFEYICKIDGDENFGHSINSIASSTLSIKMKNRLVSGSQYFQEKGLIHSAYSENRKFLTSTLMLQSIPEANQTRLFLTGRDLSKKTRNQALDVSTVKNILLKLNKAMLSG